MSLAPHQIAVGSFELLLLLAGAILWLRALAVPDFRGSLFRTNRLPHWNITGLEVALLLGLMFFCGVAGTIVMSRIATIEGAPDARGLMVIFNGVGFHGFALLGWPIFQHLRRSVQTDFGTNAVSPATATVRRGGPFQVMRSAVITLVMALPVVAAVGLLWNYVLQLFGIEAEPQDLVEVFGGVESLWVMAGIMFVACVLAPVNEEVIFRGIAYRYCRQRFGRPLAILFPSIVFGALHGNLSGFVPLSVLGAGLALAYEQTGDLRVPIVAHGLFNLNTVAVLLSGLAQE